MCRLLIIFLFFQLNCINLYSQPSPSQEGLVWFEIGVPKIILSGENIQAYGKKILTKIKLSLEKKGFVYGWPYRQTTLTINDPDEKNRINIYYTAANGNSRSFSYVCTNKKPSDCINKESNNISNYIVDVITDMFAAKNDVYDFYQRQHLAIYVDVDVDLDRKSDDDKRRTDRSRWSVESKLMDCIIRSMVATIPES